MREIKFKFWSPSLGKMFYDYRLNAIDYSTVMGHWKHAEPDLPQSIYAKNFPHLFDAVKLQYTGRKDKNGTDIYEGDIGIFNNDYHQSEVFEVKFDRYSLEKIDMMIYYNGEIIGNIYENPELLKGKE